MHFVRAFSPGHVTGFFSISDHSEDPLHRGSTGAGFCLELGVTTELTYAGGSQGGFFINHIKTPLPELISAVTRQFSGFNPEEWHISQTTALPIGCGFGTSGAAALSLALGLNHLMDHPFSNLEAAQKAHLAELQAKTGLGTVLCETFGGFEIRKTSGGPGIAVLDHFAVPEGFSGVFIVLGSYATAQMLSKDTLREKIIRSGTLALEKLCLNPTLDTFMSLSRDFTLGTDLLTLRLQSPWADAEALGLWCSMLMFGEGLFTLADSTKAPEIESLWKAKYPEAQVFSSKFDFQGGRLVHSY